ncbi:MMPL family transporter [Patulibacter medicamentivorans]|uniref:MMPL family transporter n=1 Tax=Patulibacter medicamentivorans TaxID=1097667 RepID=UPI0005915A7A|nr:MMPL family transporter [Patulibacter medicamentivorans]
MPLPSWVSDNRRALGLVGVVLVAVVAAIGVLRLSPTPVSQLLAGSGSREGAATERQERAFGGEPIVVSVTGELGTTLSPSGLVALVGLEGRLAKLDGVKAVFGPGTFINQTIVQAERLISRQLGPVATRAARAASRAERAARRNGASATAATRAGEQARLAALGPAREQFEQMLVRFGAIGMPSLSNRSYVNAVVFGAGVVPKARFRWLFPDGEHALIVVRPKAGLGDGEVLALGRRVRALAGAAKLPGAKLTVGGAPLVAAAVAHEVPTELLRLAPLALLVMAIVLLVGLRRRATVLALLGLAAAAATLSVLLASGIGLGLTAATVAGLPVILGLAVDYAVQLHARHRELRRAGRAPRQAAIGARRSLTGVLGLSAGAVVAGGLVLHLSRVPLLERLGSTLAIGAVAALAVVLAIGPRVLVSLDARGGDRERTEPAARPAGGRLGRLRLPSLPRPLRPLAIGALVVLVAAGLVLSTMSKVESDVARLAPGDLPELRDAQAVQRQVGSVGELRIALRGDVTSPATITWLRSLGSQATRIDRRIVPGPNLGEILGGDGTPTRKQVDGLLKLVPPYLVAPVLDGRQAELSFGIPFVDGREQAALAERISDRLADPPAGVRADPAGLVATAAYSLRQLESTRHWLLLACVLLVGGLLFVVRRSWSRALVPLVPALAGVGVAGLLVALLDLRLSPMAAALEPTGLAIGVEFGLLMEARYEAFRARGLDPAAAARNATRTIGRAVALSAATVAAGFLVLAASRLGMLQQLGLLVAVEVIVCAVVAVWAVPRLAAAIERRTVAPGPAPRGSGRRRPDGGDRPARDGSPREGEGGRAPRSPAAEGDPLTATAGGRR